MKEICFGRAKEGAALCWSSFEGCDSFLSRGQYFGPPEGNLRCFNEASIESNNKLRASPFVEPFQASRPPNS